MGHSCYCCGDSKPNEAFSGKGHRQHLCRECQSIPKAKRDEMELFGRLMELMDQSHISKKNVAWLKSLQAHTSESVREQSFLILQVAEVAPYRKKRYKRLQAFSPKLLSACLEAGLMCQPDGDYEASRGPEASLF